MPRPFSSIRAVFPDAFSRRPLASWMLVALIIRILSASSHSSWVHPDEWYQTAEFANGLVTGIMVYSQEVGLHLRNLTWPFLLAVPLTLAGWISPDSPGLRVFLVQAFTGALDLLIIWGWWQLSLRAVRAFGLSGRWHQVGMALLILPYFTVHDSIRPNGEHLSSVAAWLSLGLLASGRFGPAGIAAVAIAAFRYPSGLLSAGIAVAVLVHTLRGFWSGLISAIAGTRVETPAPATLPRPGARQLAHFVAGVLTGLVLFGLPDWIIYGRPWESLWMYLQYNVFTGAGAAIFGEQSPAVYWPFFKGRWFTILLPAGILLTFLAAIGFGRGLRRLEPWGLALTFYLAGHLMVGHKEARFMYPADVLLIWAAFTGILILAPGLQSLRTRAPRWARVTTGVLLALLLTANGLKGLHALIGESFKPNETYFEIARHLRDVPNACGVLTVRKLISVHLPGSYYEIGPQAEPSLPVGIQHADRHQPSFSQLSTRPVAWANAAPECNDAERILVHVHKPDPNFSDHGCQLLESGALRLLPKSLWRSALDRGWVSGPWYSCPSSILKNLGYQSVEYPLVGGFGRIEQLPPQGTSIGDLLRLGQATVPAPECTDRLCAPTYTLPEINRRWPPEKVSSGQ